MVNSNPEREQNRHEAYLGQADSPVWKQGKCRRMDKKGAKAIRESKGRTTPEV